MSQQGTIQNVTGQRPWVHQEHGPFIDWQLYVDPIGDCYITQKQGSPAPKIGDAIEFDIQKQDQHGTKIKRAWSGGGSSGGGGGGQRSSDETGRSIERQVAAKCAAEIVAAGKVEPAKITSLIGAIAKAIADEPAQQPLPVEQAVQAAQQGETPVNTEGFGEQQQPDDDIPF